MASVAIGGVVLHSHSHSSFLGNKLKLKPLSLLKKLPRKLIIYAHGGEMFRFAHDVFVGVGVGLPCTVMECGDIIYRSTLPKSNGITVTVPGVILALGTLSYLWATPGVAPGFFDMFVLAFVERLLDLLIRRMISCWGRNWVRDLLVLFIEFLWPKSHRPRVVISS